MIYIRIVYVYFLKTNKTTIKLLKNLFIIVKQKTKHINYTIQSEEKKYFKVSNAKIELNNKFTKPNLSIDSIDIRCGLLVFFIRVVSANVENFEFVIYTTKLMTNDILLKRI